MAEFAVMMDKSSRVSLQILTNGVIGLAEKSWATGGFDLRDVARQWKRSPIEEIAAAIGAVKRDLISPKYQAGESVSRIADPSKIAPGARGIAGVDADAIAMDAPGRFAERFFTRRPAHVAQDELVCRE